MIGHLEINCTSKTAEGEQLEQLPYGAWLRAPQRFRGGFNSEVSQNSLQSFLDIDSPISLAGKQKLHLEMVTRSCGVFSIGRARIFELIPGSLPYDNNHLESNNNKKLNCTILDTKESDTTTEEGQPGNRSIADLTGNRLPLLEED